MGKLNKVDQRPFMFIRIRLYNKVDFNFYDNNSLNLRDLQQQKYFIFMVDIIYNNFLVVSLKL